MSLVLSVIICLISIGILAGRVYEILMLTDAQTGFLITQGIATNPLLLAIFIVITICCGIIIFGGEKQSEPFYSKSSGIIADAAGAAFIAYGIMIMSESPSAILMSMGGIAWLLLGFTGLGKKAKDAAIMLLFVLFAAGMCFDVIIFDVYSIWYTQFMHKVLSSLSVMFLIIAVLKNVYAPSKYSRMFLYVSGFVCFAFSGMLGIAEIICSITSGQGFAADTVKNIAFALVGIYALDNALSVLPNSKKSEQCSEEMPEITVTENTEEQTTVISDVTEEISIKKEEPKSKEDIEKTDSIRKMLYSSEYTGSKAPASKSVFTKEKNVYKGDRSGKAGTEKTEKM